MIGGCDIHHDLQRPAAPTEPERHLRAAQSEARLRSARRFLPGLLSEIAAEAQNIDTLTDNHFATIGMASTCAIESPREVVP
jgi:hypothetical protein